MPSQSMRERFESRINKLGPVPEFAPTLGSCWIWTGGRFANGYGRFKFAGKDFGAHRLAYELWSGAIPDGLQIDHLCRVRECVNPAHLEPVTIAENIHRSPIALATINAAKSSCPAGHEYPTDERGCPTCRAEAEQRYRESHRAELVERTQAWQAANRERKLAYQREYMKAYRAKRKAERGGRQ